MATATDFHSIFDQDDLEALLTLAAESRVPDRLTLREFLSGEDTPEARTADMAISQPFLLMFLYGAERCCRYAVTALDASDLGELRQPSGNLLHALVAGSRAELQRRERYEAVLSMLISRLTRAQLGSLCSFCGHLGLRPVELAVHWDQFRMAERLLCNGALPLVDARMRAPHGIVTFEASDYESDHPSSRTVISPLMLLTANMDLSRVRAMKDAHILRRNGLINAWTVAIEKRHQVAYRLHQALNVIIMLLYWFVTLREELHKTIPKCISISVDERWSMTISLVFIVVYTSFVLYTLSHVYKSVTAKYALYKMAHRLQLSKNIKIKSINNLVLNTMIPIVINGFTCRIYNHCYVCRSLLS